MVFTEIRERDKKNGTVKRVATEAICTKNPKDVYSRECSRWTNLEAKSGKYDNPGYARDD